jgi:hypothetical protein
MRIEEWTALLLTVATIGFAAFGYWMIALSVVAGVQ